MHRGATLPAALAAVLLLAAAPAGAALRRGTPESGARGTRRTTAALEAAARSAPARPSRALRPGLGPSTKRAPSGAPGRAPGTAVGPPRTALSSTFSFDGPTLGSGPDQVFPPDTMGDVGPTQFIVAINSRIRSYGKATGEPDGGIDIPEEDFWAPAMTPVGGGCNFPSDPHIRYDRLSGRWIIVMIDVPGCAGEQGNRIMIAASDGPTIGPDTVWTYHHFDASAGQFADYPTLGVDANALYIGVNDFSLSSGAFTQTDGFVVRKSTILGAGAIVETPFPGLAVGAGSGPFTPQGVDNADPAASAGYFVGVDNEEFGELDLRRVGDPGGTPTLSGNLTVTVPETAFPATVPHLGNSGGANGRLDALDDRLFAATMDGAGHIWTAHNIGVDASGVASNTPSRDAARWYELTNLATTPTLAQSGTVFDPGATDPLFFWIPTVAVSGEGVMAIGGSVAGAAAPAEAWFSGRLPGDPAGQLDAPATYTSSTAAYNPPGDPGGPEGRRWGDYSLTRVDPEDDQTLWTIQEYAAATATWGVKIARLTAPPPATPAAPSPATVAQGSASTSVALGGSSAASSAYFDPGPSFPRRLAVSVGCGVAVNGVSFDGPTSLSLDLDTTSATPGSCDVTVTNPDGQSRTSAGLLQVRSSPLLTVGKGGAGSGSVTSSPPGIDCGASCAHGYPAGTSVTLTATPGAGSTFAGWTGGGCAGTGGCAVVLSTDTAVIATFDATPASTPVSTPPGATPVSAPPGATPAPTPPGTPRAKIRRTKIDRTKRSVTFSFTASGGVRPLRFECKLDRRKFTSCRSPKTYRRLRKGEHTFRLRAIDSRGRASGVAKEKFRIR